MDLVDLALNPRKANLRFNPFRTELPEGMARKLEYLFGDMASADPGERAVYSRDAAAPPSVMKMVLKRDAWAVVRPRTKGDLVELIKFANDNFVPIVPRGSGTSGYGGSVPVEGGVVVDLREFHKVLAVDKENLTVRCEGNVTFAKLDEELAKHGLALRQYPTSYYGATVAGWVAQGGGGVGSAKYGPFKRDVVEATVVQPDTSTVVYTGDDLDLVNECYGISGFIVQVVLKVRKANPIVPYLATFASVDEAATAARRLAREAAPYSLHVLTPEFIELVNQAAGQKLLPAGGKWAILCAIEDVGNAAQHEVTKGVMKSHGEIAKDADAKKAWDARFLHLNLKRLGPSVVVSEAIHSADKLKEAYQAAAGVVKMERTCFWWIAVAPGELDLIFYGLEDERRPTYPPAVGNSVAVVDAVREAVQGRAYSTGVLQCNETKRLFSRERIRALKQLKKDTDPNEVFNPGPVLGGRSRPMPLPVHDLGLQMALGGKMMKMQRGLFEYRGGDKADPSHLARERAIGRVNAGDLGSVDYEVATCIHCAFCNHVAPEAPAATMESMLPRGRVVLAKAYIEGKAAPTPEMHRKAAMNPLSHAPDAMCPVSIPIARVTDLLLGTCVDALGPLPEHAPLAAAAEKDWNVLGKPKDARQKWATVSFDPLAKTVYLPDDVAAYETPDVALNAARVVMNGGLAINTLGKAERTSGAALVETGQRDAAKAAALPMMEEMTKKGFESIVSPDANAVRAIRNDWPLFARDDDSLKVPTAQHTTTVIAAQLKAKKIEIGEPWAQKIVYHAPEALDATERAAGLEILKALGADVVLATHKECGHGRSLDKLNPGLATTIGEECLKHAKAAGATIVVTASPGCFHQLRTVAKKAKAGVEVVDLHEIVATRMKTTGGAAMAAPVVKSAEDEKPKEPVIGEGQYRVEFVKEGVILAVGKNQTILEAGEAAGMELPSSCRAGSCDTCSARWEGAAADQSMGTALSADQQKKYVLTCIAKPRGPVKIWSDERPG